MTKLEIITIPDPLLRTESHPVEEIDDDLQKFLDDMLETMYGALGIGLAAIQVAVPRRIFVMDAVKDEQVRDPICMINPEILELSGEMRIHEEGCLSLPDVYLEIERPETCHVRYLDRNGNLQERDAEGLMSTVIQHETDHLNGVLFVDYLSKLKRDMVIKKFIKAQKNESGP